MVDISVRILFFGPWYIWTWQRLRVSRWPVNLEDIFLLPLAITWILPKSFVKRVISWFFSPKILLPRIIAVLERFFILIVCG